jgi:hypothetical protein
MQLDSNIGSVITEADPTAPRTNWKPGGRRSTTSSVSTGRKAFPPRVQPMIPSRLAAETACVLLPTANFALTLRR